MPKAIGLSVRFLLIVAVALMLSSVFDSMAPGQTPYASALAPLAASPALAASRCPDKSCGSFGGPCVKAVGYFCAKSGGQCFTRGCQ